MLTEEQKQLLPERIAHRLEKVNEEYLQMIGRRIKEIGTLSASDAHRLSQMREYGADVEKITQELAEISEKNIAEIYEIYDLVAQDNAEFSEQFFEAVGKEYIPYQNNEALKRLVYALAKQTAETYINLSQDNQAYDVRQKREKGVHQPVQNLSERHRRRCDAGCHGGAGLPICNALYAARPRRQRYTHKVFAASGYSRKNGGLRKRLFAQTRYSSPTKYPLGREAMQHQRAGTAWKGIRCRRIRNRLPRKSAPEPCGNGRQTVCTGRGREVNGQYYPPFDSMSYLLSDYGCLHFKWSIICGVSVRLGAAGNWKR